VRGFDERELIDDRGNRATLELQTPDFGERLFGGVFARALVFLDHGWLHRNHALPGETVRDSLASAGIGLRMTYSKRASFRLDLAQILQETPNRDNDSQRLTGSLAIVF